MNGAAETFVFKAYCFKDRFGGSYILFYGEEKTIMCYFDFTEIERSKDSNSERQIPMLIESIDNLTKAIKNRKEKHFYVCYVRQSPKLTIPMLSSVSNLYFAENIESMIEWYVLNIGQLESMGLYANISEYDNVVKYVLNCMKTKDYYYRHYYLNKNNNSDKYMIVHIIKIDREQEEPLWLQKQ